MLPAFVPQVVAFASLYILRLGWERITIPLKWNSKKRENSWYALYYSTMMSWAIQIISKSPWVFNEACPLGSLENLEYYHVQIGFYASSLIFLVNLDERRRDFQVMLLHHFVTLFLVYMSFHWKWHQIGFCILALHDVADVFLFSSKFLHEISHENESRIYNVATYIVFGAFVVSFAITRLWIFPKYFIMECWKKTEVYGYHGNSMLAALWCLYAMHCYWMVQIVQMIIRLIKEPPSKVQDVREKK